VVGIGPWSGEGSLASLMRVDVNRETQHAENHFGSAVLAVFAPAKPKLARERRLVYRRAAARELETIGSLNSIVRPLRNTLTVAVDPIGASETRRENCDGSSI
jgi:hypothetical protein